MRVVVAPDSFKGSLTAADAAEAISDGFASIRPDWRLDICPVADGGEGTLDVLLQSAGGVRRIVSCTSPTNESITAAIGLIERGGTAVVEFARAGGLSLVPPERRDPLRTTSYGVGELIAAGLDCQVDRVIVTLGGSATVDGGCGMAQALGCVMLDEHGRPLASPLLPSGMMGCREVRSAEMIERFTEVSVVAAVDVLNPLLGPQGAAAVFGPQKGADAAGVARLEAALSRWADLVESACGRRLRDEPGMGAAGGAALPLVAFADATTVPGADLVFSIARVAERVASADLVITGEGCLDGQTLMGKGVGSLARLAKSAGVPCMAIVGRLGRGCEAVTPMFERVATLARAGDAPGEAEREAESRLRQTAAELAGEWDG